MKDRISFLEERLDEILFEKVTLKWNNRLLKMEIEQLEREKNNCKHEFTGECKYPQFRGCSYVNMQCDSQETK